MATSQWLQDNPKVLAYVSRDLHGKLCQFKKDHKIKSISEAINFILKSFFEPELPLRQSADQNDMSLRERDLESRVAALEKIIGTLISSGGSTASDLFNTGQKPSIQREHEKSNLLTVGQDSFVQESYRKSDSLSENSKSLNIPIPIPCLSPVAPPPQIQEKSHLSQQNRRDSVLTQIVEGGEVDGEEIEQLAFSENRSESTTLAGSANNIQIFGESSLSNFSTDSMNFIEDDLPIVVQKTLVEEETEKSGLLLTDSESLNLSFLNTPSPQLKPPLHNQEGNELARIGHELPTITQVNEYVSKEELARLMHLKGVLGLLDRGSIKSTDTLQSLMKSIRTNPSCVCFSILKNSILIRMIRHCDNLSFENFQDRYKYLNKNRTTPYLVIRDGLNKQLYDPINPLNLDQSGKNIIIPKARDLAVLIKQLRKKKDIFQVYIIPLSMLSRMLAKAGFPVTSKNLLKVRCYVEEIYKEALSSLYKDLLNHAKLFRKKY
jgi:hypothetical protein